MHYLITGGSGFLGYHLIKKLLANKHQISILDRSPLPETNLLNKVTFVQGDVRSAKDVQMAMKNVDIVIHAAASLPLEAAEQIKTTTIKGTEVVLRQALKSKVKRVVYISSTAVYGIPKKHPILETDPLVGVGPYGHAKIEAERICEKYRRKGLIISIVRPKTFIGTERLGVFQILFNWVRLGKRIPIIGNGQNRYQLLEVEDLVDAILLLATSTQKTKINDTFNVGAEIFSTVNEDVGALCAYAGTGARVLPTPAWMAKTSLRILDTFHLSPLYRWVYDTADKDSFVSIEKIKKRGWTPARSNQQTLINAYRWYLKHYEEFESQSGTTHRVGWDQGALAILKRFL